MKWLQRKTIKARIWARISRNLRILFFRSSADIDDLKYPVVGSERIYPLETY